MKKVVTVGGATQDIFIHYEDDEYKQIHREDHRSFLLLEEGTKIEVKNIHYASGGGATNSAAGLQQLGFDTQIFCKLGSDCAGHFVAHDLQNLKIGTDFVVISESEQTGTSFIIPSPSGNRTIFAHRGANNTLKEEDLPLQKLTESDGVYITSLPSKSAELLPTITRHAHQNNALVANNPGKKQLTEHVQTLTHALQNIDIFILNAHEARIFLSTLSKDAACMQRLTEQSAAAPEESPSLFKNFTTINNLQLSLTHYFKEILGRGPKIVVVTNGEEGVYAATHDKLYFHKAITTDVINTVGAGDSFSSCFFGSILNGCDIETALTFGTLNSASVLNTPNAKTGLLSFKELEKRKKRLPINLLQTLNW